MNLTTSELQKQLRPIMSGDPLGLGINRPPPPNDPDIYDEDEQRISFARASLSDDKLNSVRKEGFLSIDEVRQFFRSNRISMQDSYIDPEMVVDIDIRTNYKTFITDDGIYSREELYNNYPFHEFGIQPEVVFSQQLIGVFQGNIPDEYTLKDADDLNSSLARVNRCGEIEQPIRTLSTKVYLGKSRWTDFLSLHREARTKIMMSTCGSKSPIIGMICGSVPSPSPPVNPTSHARPPPSVSPSPPWDTTKKITMKTLSSRIEVLLNRIVTLEGLYENLYNANN